MVNKNNRKPPRKFGVELELGVPCRRNGRFFDTSKEICETFAEYGLECREYGFGYSTWVIKEDCSVHVPKCDDWEITTPILSGPQGYDELYTGVSILSEDFKAKINRTCGLHVHVDVRDLTRAQKGAVFSRYRQFQKQINKCMHRSRCGGNAYNPDYSTSWYDQREFLEDEARVIAGHIGPSCLDSEVLMQKYQGTIEFRQHVGSVDPDRVYNWVRWCVNFVNTSARLAADRQKLRKQKNFVFKNDNPLNGLRVPSAREEFANMVA